MSVSQSKICRAIAKHSRRPCRAWTAKGKEYCRDHEKLVLSPVAEDNDEKIFPSLNESPTVILSIKDEIPTAMGYGEWMWSFFPKLW